MQEKHSLRLYLFLLRSGLLTGLLGQRPVFWVAEALKKAPQAGIGLVVSELMTSSSPRYSDELLRALSGLPGEVLEASGPLRHLFSEDRLGCPSSREAITLCRVVLSKCFLLG